MAELFAGYDVFVTLGAATPAFDVMMRDPPSIADVKLEHYMAGSMLNAAITMAGCPAVAVPCGFDQHGRPVGLPIAAPGLKPRPPRPWSGHGGVPFRPPPAARGR